ncbi:MAG: macro domain-containing protein [Lachnospiraceae bacterium]
MIKSLLKELKDIFILVFWWMDSARLYKMVEKFFAIWGILSTACEIERIAKWGTIVEDVVSKYFLAILIGSVIYAFISTKKMLSYTAIIKDTGIKISLSIGNLFWAKTNSFVISTNTTFDTKMDNEFISKNSVQGQFQLKYFRNNLQSLDKMLTEGLKEELPIYLNRKMSKCKQYPIGTVSKINYKNKHYYFSAIADINEEGKTINTSIENVKKCLLGTWEFISQKGHVEELAIPVIGTGKAGVPNLSIEKAIMEMIYSIVDFSRTKKISDHFYIRIHPSDIRKNNINMDELNAFLQCMCNYRKEIIEEHMGLNLISGGQDPGQKCQESGPKL